MIGKIQVKKAESGHQGSVMLGDEMPVVAEVRISWQQMCGVLVARRCGAAVGIVDERTLKFVGNDAKLIAAHLQQRVNAGVDANSVGRRNEFAVGDESKLMRARDDPLRIGSGGVPFPPQNARAEMRGGVDLVCRVLGT